MNVLRHEYKYSARVIPRAKSAWRRISAAGVLNYLRMLSATLIGQRIPHAKIRAGEVKPSPFSGIRGRNAKKALTYSVMPAKVEVQAATATVSKSANPAAGVSVCVGRQWVAMQSSP